MGKFADFRKCTQENSRTYETMESCDQVAGEPQKIHKMTPQTTRIQHDINVSTSCTWTSTPRLHGLHVHAAGDRWPSMKFVFTSTTSAKDFEKSSDRDQQPRDLSEGVEQHTHSVLIRTPRTIGSHFHATHHTLCQLSLLPYHPVPLLFEVERTRMEADLLLVCGKVIAVVSLLFWFVIHPTGPNGTVYTRDIFLQHLQCPQGLTVRQ